MSTTSRASTTLIAVLMAVLVAVEVALIGSDLDNTIRYGVGAVVLVALVVGAFQLGRSR